MPEPQKPNVYLTEKDRRAILHWIGREVHRCLKRCRKENYTPPEGKGHAGDFKLRALSRMRERIEAAGPD